MLLGLAFLEVVVTDIGAAVAWYSGALGFRLSGEVVDNEDGRWCQLVTESGDTRLALWQPTWVPHPDGKSRPSFIPVFEVRDLRALVDGLAANGIPTLEEIRERVGYRITSVSDLDGNMLQLFETTA